MYKILTFALAAMMLAHPPLQGQNLVTNPSFEALFNSPYYPHDRILLDSLSPASWFDFGNNGEYEYWLTDSTWIAPYIGAPNPNFTNGYYNVYGFSTNYPTYPHSQGEAQIQEAHNGSCYVGFELITQPFFAPNGVQQLVAPCGLNSGDYQVAMWVSRTYGSNQGYPQGAGRLYSYLSPSVDQKQLKIGEWNWWDDIVAGDSAGTWNRVYDSFTLSNPEIGEFRWLAITGRSGLSDDVRNYIYLDDVDLYRPCDGQNQCLFTVEQICPDILWPNPTSGKLVSVSGIDNAQIIDFRLTNLLGQTVLDTSFSDPNGFVNGWYFPSVPEASQIAQGIYYAKLTIGNTCGEISTTHELPFIDPIQQYSTSVPPWDDSRTHWSLMYRPCCLDVIVLSNDTLVGDLQYIARSQIIVGPHIAVDTGSTVYLQAPDSIVVGGGFDSNGGTVDFVVKDCPPGWFRDPEGEKGEALRPAPVTALRPAMAEGDAKPGALSLLIAPNPSNGLGQLILDNPTAQWATISILDGQMREVRALHVGDLPEGTSRFELEFEELHAGIYFVRLQASTEQITKRFVIQH